jgi:hypothetical protein
MTETGSFQLFCGAARIQRNILRGRSLSWGMLHRFARFIWLSGGLSLAGSSATIDLRPVADTTLHSIAPGNNMGGHTHVAIGTTGKDTPARGLFRFDLSTIPAEAAVTSVTLTFTLPALNRPDTGGSIYAAHRMLKDWGEGTKSGNLGATATAGEATWEHSALPTLWTAPGGAAGTDYAETASAAANLGPAPGVYSIASTAGLVDDVQHWLTHPEENFGWLLKVEDESVGQSARQFASRESANGPLLRVEYSVGPAPELRITAIERTGTNVVIRWTGPQRSVVVERATDLNGSWQPLGSSTDAFTNSITGQRAFLRLREE